MAEGRCESVVRGERKGEEVNRRRRLGAGNKAGCLVLSGRAGKGEQSHWRGVWGSRMRGHRVPILGEDSEGSRNLYHITIAEP